MSITYEIKNFENGAKTTELTFTDDDGLVYNRQVNIPYNSDGSVDEDYFLEICEGQLRGVKNKLKVGVIEFKDPSEIPSGIGSTETQSIQE